MALVARMTKNPQLLCMERRRCQKGLSMVCDVNLLMPETRPRCAGGESAEFASAHPCPNFRNWRAFGVGVAVGVSVSSYLDFYSVA